MELAVFQSIGPIELIIVLVIVLLIFGPKRLPSLGRQLGSGMREFKDSITGKDSGRDEDAADDAAPGQKTELPSSQAQSAPVDGEVVSERTPR